MTSIAAMIVRSSPGLHDTVLVYAGPDDAHLAHVGSLVMLKDEAEAFVRLINAPMDTVADAIRKACTAGIRDGKACGICERIITVTREAL